MLEDGIRVCEMQNIGNEWEENEITVIKYTVGILDGRRQLIMNVVARGRLHYILQ